VLELRDFQQQASDLITDRFRRYSADPPMRGARSTQRRVPFFQALSSITASGKTVILADAVQAMSAELATAPIILWLSKGKVVVQFDALVGFGSAAYEQVLRTADDVVTAYTENILLVQSRPNPHRVGPVLVRPDDLKTFSNSLHEGYSDLNPEELACARALDTTGLAWYRNPARSGYGIPLITIGRTRTFYPDFLVWTGEEGDSDVYAIDTTGAHLLADKTGRKMLAIRPPRGSNRELNVRFISRGRQDAQLTSLDDEGYSVWGRRSADGSLRVQHAVDLHTAVERALQGM